MTLNNVLEPSQLYGISQQAVINGNFDIWERGTSFTNPASSTYTTDRWFVGHNGSGLPTTLIHSKQILTSGDILGSFYFYRINTDGAGTSTLRYRLEQKIENGCRYLCGLNKKITISFWARSSISNKKIGIATFINYGTGGSPSASESINGYNATLSSTWTKYSFTFTTNTLVGKTFGTNNDDYLDIEFGLAWDSATQSNWGASAAETFVSSGNIDITQVLVNSGDSIITFQPKSIYEEIYSCQRYTTAYTNANISFPIGNGFALSTTQARIQVDLPETMRISPTLTATATDWKLSDGVTATDITTIAIETDQSSNKTITLLCTVASGLTQFRPYQLIADGTANRLMIFSAEL